MPDPIQPDPLTPTPPPPRKRKSRLKIPGIVLASSVALILSGCGLCSVGGMSFEGQDKYPVIVSLGFIAFWGGVLGLIVGFIWFLVAIVATASDSRSQGRSQ